MVLYKVIRLIIQSVLGEWGLCWFWPLPCSPPALKRHTSIERRKNNLRLHLSRRQDSSLQTTLCRAISKQAQHTLINSHSARGKAHKSSSNRKASTQS